MNDTGASHPLTRSQQLIWTGQHLQPEEPLYNMALSFRIQGALDVDVFQRAFARLVQQCDALRITFSNDQGVAHQRVHNRFDYELPFVDFCHEADPDAALDAWQGKRVQRLFDFSTCLFDSVLLRLSDHEHVWFLNQHHLTTDAWSTSVLYEQMSTLYQLAERDALDDAPSLPSFVDFIEKESSPRNAKAVARAQTYWDERLQRPFTPSNFYRSTPPQRSGRTRRVPCALGTERTARIRALASSPPFQAITPDLAQFQLFATVYFAWLHRLNGERQLAIGTPSHNRGSASLKRTPGMFIEVYPLQVDVDVDETFASLYEQVAQMTRQLLVNAPPGASSFAHHRAYDVVLNYITAQYGPFAGRDMTSTWVHADHGDRGHLVRIQVEDFDRSDEFGVFFDLHEDVFVGADIDRAQRDFLTLLDALLDDPAQTLETVPLIDGDARARKLALGASQATQPAPTISVLDAFDARAKESPQAPALTSDGLTLSYLQLQNASSHVATQLREMGVTHGDIVAIAMPRSAQAVVAILAAMRCGAAYVPIDTAYPASRISMMLDDAQPVVVITAPNSTAAISSNVQTYVLGELNVADTATHACTARGNDCAYLIYTSGSTGRPKGVKVLHGGLSNYAHWAAATYSANGPSSWPLFSSLAFDLTVTSIFVPLISGGRIVVYGQNDAPGDLVIREVIEDDQVDVIKLTPAHLSLILPMDLSALRLRTLIVGGEDFKVELARAVDRFFDGRVAIYNEYGPTEGTVACMIHRFDAAAGTGASVPIGRAIDHAHIYILDERAQLMPLGAVGEIVIGGAGVAAGYRDRDELTAARFVDNPFRPGEKMYRTGDLGRWRDDGALAYLGRRDEQIKVNGVRVELGEIEAALAAVPGVSSAAARLSTHDAAEEETFCQRCGLSGRHPNARLDDQQVCHICRVYEDERERALNYFGTLDDLQTIVDRTVESAPAKPDSIMLLSGGKDSTYALCQLVDMGLTPLVFTLDNGFISEGAKANMRRVVDKLGLELVVGTTPSMNDIFVDSLKRFSNVCNGCFKTIYTLSVNLARERGITRIFTGLSRGQIFETRVADQFQQRIFDPGTIDRNIIEARKAYHRADDTVSRTMDVSVFADDAVFQEIQYVDFYRYTDVSLDQMLSYLSSRVPWVRPADTGRSTNCLINEAGIFVHKNERGFHNYSLPYSWDVRLGHKQRDSAREELDDHIDIDNVRSILDEIGYEMPGAHSTLAAHRQLFGYYVSDQPIDTGVLRDALSKALPGAVIPSVFVQLDALPLTQNGKIDRTALPDPDAARPDLEVEFVTPDGVVERKLAAIWQHVLGVDRVGAQDNFFDLGGDSILNIQIVARARKHGLTLQPQQIFEHPTVAQLAGVVGDAAAIRSEQGSITGQVALNPIQQRFFERQLPNPNIYNQCVTLVATGPIQTLALEESLRQIVRQHDALRARFAHQDGEWQQTLLAPEDVEVALEVVALGDTPATQHEQVLAATTQRLNESMSVGEGRLVRAALLDRGESVAPWLVLCVHHLAVDGVSWWVLLEDLQSAYTQLRDGHPVALPPKTSSVRRFVDALTNYANDGNAPWQPFIDATPGATPLPRDSHYDGTLRAGDTQRVTVSLTREETTGALVDTATTWRTQAPDVLLTALADTLTAYNDGAPIQVDVEGHGRENISPDIDVLRTIGWFTSVYPLTLTSNPTQDIGGRVRSMKERLRALPDRGLAYGAARYLSRDQKVVDALATRPQSDVQFNYLGQWDRARAGGHWFRFAQPLALCEDAAAPREHLLAIDAMAYDGQLTITWTYSPNVHQRQTIEQLAQTFKTSLVALASACRAGNAAALAPSDFPTAELNQDALDDLLADFGDLP